MFRTTKTKQIFNTLLGLLWLVCTTACHGQETGSSELQAPQQLEVRRELNRLLQDPAGLPEAIQYLDSVLDKFPTDSDIHLRAISLNASHGVKLLSEEKVEAAHKAIRRAEELAKAVAANPKRLQAAETMLADVFFHAAQTYATDENSAAMYAALDQAHEMGFEDWELVEEAKPFATLITTEEFKAYLQKQKSLVSERIAIRLQKELKEFESFDFDFDLKSVAGEPMTKSLWKGKLLVVDIWGTWCPPCRQALPHLIEMQNEYGPQGLQIVGLNLENEETVAEQAETVKAAIQEFKINYPCGLIDSEFVESIPDFEGFPTALLIDGQGRVRLKLVGAQSPTRLETAIKILLEEAKSNQP